MITTILQTLYYTLPGLVANMTPVLVKNHFRFLAVPVDFHIKVAGKPLFGSHKTYRGLIFGVLAAILTAFIQGELYRMNILTSISYIDYSRVCFICLGASLGFGALCGDLMKSFFKRRLGMKEGTRWFPWDQVDYALGIIAFCFLIKPLTSSMVLILLFAAPLLSIAATRIGYYLKVRKEKW